MHGSADALHAVECVANGAVALLSSVERAARRFGAGFGVVGNLFHRDGELFDSARGVSDFLILLGCASLHFVGGHKNVVGAGSNFHGRFANALQHLSEVVEHVVDGIGDVTKRVVGHFSAQGQFAARHLIDHRKKFSDAALQIFAGFLIGVGLGHFGYCAVQVFRNVAELIVGLQVNARACIPGGDPLGEFRELLHRRDHRAAQAPGEKSADRQRQQCSQNHAAARAAWQRCEVQQGLVAGFAAGMECQSDYNE